HDHKYDPISQADYFRMYAFFNSIPEGGRASGGRVDSPMGAIAEPWIPAPSPEQVSAKARFNEAIQRRLASIHEPNGELWGAYQSWVNARPGVVKWETLIAESITSSSGLPFRDLGDGSWLVDSDQAVGGGESYTFTAPMKGNGWQQIQLEALMHESLPNGGPGRFKNANAVLSEIRLIQIGPSGDETVINLQEATASYEQEGYPASNLVTAPGGKGWGFFNPKMEDRKLTLTTQEPFGEEGDWTLEVRLHFSQRWANHVYGRIRLGASQDAPLVAKDDTLKNLLSKETSELSREDREKLSLAFLKFHDPAASRQLLADIASLAEVETSIPTVMVMEEMDVPRPTYVLARGAYDAPVGDPLEPGAPAALNEFLDEYPRNRLGFAQWLTSRENPLTARVAVNHLWDRFFGVGIVKTVEDFGAQSEWPSHPALLDWLAIELIESGWDIQHIVRLILESHTYRQSSFERPALTEIDPDNRLVGRGPRGRLKAEVIRDQALAVGGLLNPEVGGPGVNPYQPAGIWEELTLRPGYAMSYDLSEGKQIYRRSLYTFYKRAAPPAMMAVFDAPSREICTVRRETTNTPLQALALLNGETYVEASRGLAQKLLQQKNENATVDDLLRYAFLSVVQRDPSDSELSVLRNVFESERARSSDEESVAILEVGRLPVDEELSKDELLGLTMVNRMLFNLSETVSRH
ncbi:MAG: DUF1553 domain-containing protein, partial [Verrucomicrobiota bacterium]